MDETELVVPCQLSYEVHGKRCEPRLRQPLITLGRDGKCDVVLPENEQGVSRHHATLLYEDGGWRVKDNSSRNGTFVNQIPVESKRLQDGDVINLGPFAMRFRFTPPIAPADLSQDFRRRVADEQVEFNDGPRPDVSASIDVANLSRSLGTIGGSTTASGPAGGGKLESLAEGVYDLSANRSQPLAVGGLGIELFRELGEVLLTSADLDQMLDKILDLVFAHVPAERGLICLCGSGPDDLVPRVTKTRRADLPDKVRISRSIANEAITAQRSLLVSDVASDSRFAEAHSIRSLNITSAMCVPLYREGHVDGLIYVDTQSRTLPFMQGQLELLTAMSLFSAVALEQARLRDEVAAEQQKRARLSRYHSAAVVEQIVARTESDEFIADDREVSILFADLCGFTTLSERLSPAEVVRLLNTVFELLSACVFDYKGTLDKFMGDGMLAFFGAPLAQPDHAERAVRAALRMQHELEKYNQDLDPQARIGLRIGVNSGPAIVGDIGSATRKDYTVIGDTVNVASRLESSVAQPGQVVIGPATYEQVHKLILCKKLPPTTLKGKQQSIEPYRAIRPRGERETAEVAVIGE